MQEFKLATQPHALEREILMKVRKFTITDAVLERSPGQDGDVFVGNLIDQRHASPITIGYGRYGPNQTLEETMAVDDVMVVLEGRLSVSGKGRARSSICPKARRSRSASRPQAPSRANPPFTNTSRSSGSCCR
jgi:ethanolamine utilization protein EutQ (cupin superfamily)